jgi:hypothetical protein
LLDNNHSIKSIEHDENFPEKMDTSNTNDN